MAIEEALRLFNLKRGYTESELKQVYRKLARQYHPDVSGGETTNLFMQINEAYELLTNHLGETGCKLTHTSIFKVKKV